MKSNWLPIETAPKDGTAIDIWTEWGRKTDVYWDGTHWKAGCAIFSNPTHWMPVPDAPNATTPFTNSSIQAAIETYSSMRPNLNERGCSDFCQCKMCQDST